jgi:capsular exopolysaccharide synthesis family protein
MQTQHEVLERSPRPSRRGVSTEGGLPELLDAVRWRWKPTLAIALLFTAGATAFVENLPPKYDGEALVSVQPRPKTADSNLVRVVGPKYSDYVTAPSTIAAVAPTIGETRKSLDNAITAHIATDTGNITITARMPSPQRAARAANAFAASAVAFSKKDPLLEAQLVAEALPNRQPASPPRRLLELASLFVGCLIAIVVSVLLERGRPRLRSWRDVARVTGYPVLGRIPPSRMLTKRPLRAFSDVHSASAFRILRANLEPQLREGGLDFLVVTSPSAGDGKTTIAALLAESFARLGMRVLLVDADLRRPGLSRMTAVRSSPGLADVLHGRARLDDAVYAGWVPGLHVVPTTSDSDASELLFQNFGDALEDVRDQFDITIVDTSPLLSTDDPRTLAAIAKGLVLVVSASSSQASMNEAVMAVESLNAPLLGIVANRFKEAGASYYY